MTDKPADNLIERIDEAILSLNDEVVWANAQGRKKDSRDYEDIIQTLTDCRTCLSPPVIDGGLEKRYKEMLVRLDNSFLESEYEDVLVMDESEYEDVRKVITDLHDELERKKKTEN